MNMIVGIESMDCHVNFLKWPFWGGFMILDFAFTDNLCLYILSGYYTG
jgi:hypothetical protein